MSSSWLVEPRMPLVVRDGRPNDGRSSSRTLPMVLPSTIAGVARTRLGSDEQGRFELAGRAEPLLQVAVRGPILMECGALRPLAPAPADALLLRDDSNTSRLRALRPISLPEGASTSLPEEHRPIGLEKERALAGKPARDAPRWWAWGSLEAWLTKPRDLDGEEADEFLRGGLASLPVDRRVHVEQGPGETAEEGMLFATSGLCFSTRADDAPGIPDRDLGLLVEVEDATLEGRARTIREGLAPFAGERRLVHWRRLEADPWPAPPAAMVSHVARPGRSCCLRLLLLTPALFAGGWRPNLEGGPLSRAVEGVSVRLIGAAVGRPTTASGWDFARRAPKASRRAAPAGAVYWLELEGDAAARSAWLERVWMSNVSDEAQDRRDGWGLAALGVA